MKTTIAVATLHATLSTGFIITGCDAQDEALGEESDDDSPEDHDDRGGCTFPTTDAPEPDPRFFYWAGMSSGGCDLMVIYVNIPGNTSGLGFTFEAVADSPISARNAFVWARSLNAGTWSPWQRFGTTSGSWTDPEIGYCDAARTEPCAYRTRGHLALPENEEFKEYRVGTRVLDDEGDPVTVSFEIES